MHQLEFIDARQHEQHLQTLLSIWRLRHKTFVQRLNWPNGHNMPIRAIAGMEIDQFDTLQSTCYIVHRAPDGEVDGAARLHPTSGPHLLGDVYPHMIEDGRVFRSDKVWEVTRFCSDTQKAPRSITALLVCGLIEFALHYELEHLVSVTDVRLEPALDRTGWRRQRLGQPVQTDTDLAAAEIYEVTRQDLERVRCYLGIEYNLINFAKSLANAA
jgi:N-acyl-L-homoserine lactone synthetase